MSFLKFDLIGFKETTRGLNQKCSVVWREIDLINAQENAIRYKTHFRRNKYNP
jgi:hypothetical protein